MAPLNEFRGGPPTSDARVMFMSENPKIKVFFIVFWSSLPPTISPQNDTINIVIAKSCFLVWLRGGAATYP